jgi:hypothetical protein
MKAGQAKVRAILVLRFIFNKGMQGLHSKREGEEKQKQLLTHTDSMLLSAFVKAASTSNLLYLYEESKQFKLWTGNR